MSERRDKEPTFFALRIHDAETLRLINELAAKSGNRNAVLNDALKLGVPALYERVFGKDTEAEKKKREHNPSVARELKELRKVIDDLFVLMNVHETMIAGLFNVKAAELDGEEVNAESLLDGSMCDLPELVAGLKADLTRTGDRNGQ